MGLTENQKSIIKDRYGLAFVDKNGKVLDIPELLEILELRRAFVSEEDIAKKYNISPWRVRHFIKKGKIYLARDMRYNQTEAEKLLNERLRHSKLEYRIATQKQKLGYIVDFYCYRKALVIEVDGPIHNTKKNKEYDDRKDQRLTKAGYKVIRFKNEEVINDLDRVVETIKQILEKTPDRIKKRSPLKE